MPKTTIGRYDVIEDEENEIMWALKDGSRWRELTGGKSSVALITRIAELEGKLKAVEHCLKGGEHSYNNMLRVQDALRLIRNSGV